jgi:hypothetical protein
VAEPWRKKKGFFRAVRRSSSARASDFLRRLVAFCSRSQDAAALNTDRPTGHKPVSRELRTLKGINIANCSVDIDCELALRKRRLVF